jgi:hypothetical protein
LLNIADYDVFVCISRPGPTCGAAMAGLAGRSLGGHGWVGGAELGGAWRSGAVGAVWVGGSGWLGVGQIHRLGRVVDPLYKVGW